MKEGAGNASEIICTGPNANFSATLDVESRRLLRGRRLSTIAKNVGIVIGVVMTSKIGLRRKWDIRRDYKGFCDISGRTFPFFINSFGP